jgi:hypothetical protein
MGTLFLKLLDDRMVALGCFYVRYMSVLRHIFNAGAEASGSLLH